MYDNTQRNFLFFIFLFYLVIGLDAQEILLERNFQNSVISKKTGINYKSFGYLFINYQVYALKSSSDLDIETLKSHNYSFGYRRVYRVTDLYSVLGGLSFFNDSYTIHQGVDKTFPTSQIHESERVVTYNFSGEFYNRFILKKEYDCFGLFLDFGAYISASVASRHKMFDTSYDPGFYGKTQELKVKGLKYIEPITYGLSFRFGYNRIAMVVHHRLSNWIKPSYGFAQPPKTSVGLELSLY